MLSDGSSKFLDGAGIDEHLQADTLAGSLSYLNDHLGSTSQLLDSVNGLSKASLDYKSYGKLEGDIANPLPTNSYAYTGREDDGTGLMYYRARYYDPELEAFISQDPLGDAQRYVGGNPVSFTDLLGLELGYSYNTDGSMTGPFSQQALDSMGRTGEAAWNFLYGNDLNTLADPNTSLGEKAWAASSFIPVCKVTKLGKIGGKITGYTRHGIHSAISHSGGGVNPRALLDAVKNPIRIIHNNDGSIRYKGRDATVILDQKGIVITTWPRNTQGIRLK